MFDKEQMLNKALWVASIAALFVFGALLSLQIGENPQEEALGYRENTTELTIFNATTTASVGDGQSIVYYRHIGITVATEATTGTLKFQASLADTEPDWSAAQSLTNTWDYIQVVDSEDGSTIDGDTGITLANTTDVRQFEANSNNFRWFNADLSGSVSGTTTVKIKPADNQ